MIIAQEKRKSNIAEYILYMWQVEDIIRANDFDIIQMEQNLLSKFNQPNDIQYEIREWYSGLIEMMKEEGITKKGHLRFLKTITQEMNDVHIKLLQKEDEDKYISAFKKAESNIIAFRKKINDALLNDIEVCLTALYAILLLRIQKKEISKQTGEAISTFSNLLAFLSQKFILYEKGQLEL